MRELSETIMEINDLHKLFLNFQEPEQNRQWTPQEPREISRNMVKINDLRKVVLGNQRLTHGTANGRQPTTTVGRDSVEA